MTIGNIAAALAKAQANFAPIRKDRSADTGKYKYDYADLASILDAVRPALSANEIAILQPVEAEAVEGGGVAVKARTLLVHSSGESLESPPLTVVSVDSRPQSVGGAATYARRYSLTAMLSIAADEDEDGSAASGIGAQTTAKPAGKPPAKPAPSSPNGALFAEAAWTLAKRIYGSADKARDPWKAACTSIIGDRDPKTMTQQESLDIEAILTEGANAPADIPF
jgi:hypothetical protein